MAKTSKVHFTRLHRFRKGGKFHSRMIRYTKHRFHKTVSRLIPKVAKHLWRECSTDDLKAPLNNKPAPAMTSPSAFNIYLGTNRSANLEDGLAVVERTAYALGSGASSTCLNPETMRIYSMTPELIKLMGLVSQILKDSSQTWEQTLNQTPFNSVSVKLYFSFRKEKQAKTVLVRKNTGWHADVLYDDKGVGLPSNSQVPGTPVAILTCGDRKNLWFRRGRAEGTKEGTKRVYDDETTLHFAQENCSLFVLDPRDEVPDEDGVSWFHMSDLVGEPVESVAYSISFRCVQLYREVNALTHQLIEPTITPVKTKLFRSPKYQNLMTTPEYKATMEALGNRMTKLLDLIK